MLTRVIYHPLSPLLALTLVQAIFLSIYAANGAVPSPAMEMVVSVGWVFMLFAFIAADARRRRGLPFFDFGLFAYYALPLAITYYAFWSRGLRGALLLLGLFLLMILPLFVAGMLAIASGFDPF